MRTQPSCWISFGVFSYLISDYVRLMVNLDYYTDEIQILSSKTLFTVPVCLITRSSCAYFVNVDDLWPLHFFILNDTYSVCWLPVVSGTLTIFRCKYSSASSAHLWSNSAECLWHESHFNNWEGKLQDSCLNRENKNCLHR